MEVARSARCARMTTTGDECYWLTKGAPDSWPIVVLSEGRHREFQGTITEFLIGATE
jgi:hypothetical protein